MVVYTTSQVYLYTISSYYIDTNPVVGARIMPGPLTAMYIYKASYHPAFWKSIFRILPPQNALNIEGV